MDSINSFKGYGKVDEAEQQAFRKKSRKRLIIIVVSFIVLLAVIIGAVIGVVVRRSSCFSSISALEMGNTTDPAVLFKLSLRVAMNELSKLKDYLDVFLQLCVFFLYSFFGLTRDPIT